jgi:WD40 repeat protein
VHDLATGAAGTPYVIPALTAADSSPDGATLAGVTDDGRLIRLATTDGVARPAPDANPDTSAEFYSVDMSSDGRYLAALGANSVIWDLDRHAIVAQLNTALEAEFSADGRHLALSSAPECEILALAGGSANAPFGQCEWSLVFSPDGVTVAGVSDSGVEVNRGGVVTQLGAQARWPGVRFSPDGAWLASSSGELWNTKDWSPRTALPDYVPPGLLAGDSASSVAFSPDGSQVLLVTSFRDRSLATPAWKTYAFLRRVDDWEHMRSFVLEPGRFPTFSPDGDWIAFGPRLLHLATSTETMLDPATQIARFLPDGRIVAGSPNDVVTFYCPSGG